MAINRKEYRGSVPGVVLLRSSNIRHDSSIMGKKEAWFVKEGLLQVVKVPKCESRIEKGGL